VTWRAAPLLVAAALAAAGSGPPSPGGPPEVTPEGWARAGPPQRFAGEDLFLHIDGGAEIFHEFGFVDLVVTSYEPLRFHGHRLPSSPDSGGQERLGLEIYRMRDATAALGVYLMKCGAESPLEGIPARHTGGCYQFTLLKGACFIQINNFGGNEANVPAMKGIALGVLAGIEDAPPDSLLRVLPPAGRVPGSERLFRGPYALEPIFTLGDGDILRLGGEICGVKADYRGDDGSTFTRLVVPYPSPALARAAFEDVAGRLDPYLALLERRPDVLLFRDSSGLYGTVGVMQDTIAVAVRLRERPVLP
jgi:hypothetical protein